MGAIASDQRLAGGLAAFANWCAAQGISPEEVDDATLQRIGLQAGEPGHSIQSRATSCAACRMSGMRPAKKSSSWPKTRLTALSFQGPRKRLPWEAFTESFRRDVQAYLALRAEPDVFDERPHAPRRPLAASTLRGQSEHLRLAASILVESGVAVEEINCLADLIQSERFKTILRHYHSRANGQPNAFVIYSKCP